MKKLFHNATQLWLWLFAIGAIVSLYDSQSLAPIIGRWLWPLWLAYIAVIAACLAGIWKMRNAREKKKNGQGH
jgi:hypothetical protein